MIETITSPRITLANGYSFSRVINGCWQLSEGHSLSGALDMDDVMRAFHMLVERGFTTFDCADIYTGAEDFIGRFVRELKARGGYSHDSLQHARIHRVLVNLLRRQGAAVAKAEFVDVPVSSDALPVQTAPVQTTSAKAQENSDADYTPLAVIGQQVVAGMNYRILAELKNVEPGHATNYVIVTLYKALDGSAEITDVAEMPGEEY